MRVSDCLLQLQWREVALGCNACMCKVGAGLQGGVGRMGSCACVEVWVRVRVGTGAKVKPTLTMCVVD